MVEPKQKIASLKKENRRLKETLMEIMEHFGENASYVDWGFENNMGIVQIKLSKSTYQKWEKAAQ